MCTHLDSVAILTKFVIWEFMGTLNDIIHMSLLSWPGCHLRNRKAEASILDSKLFFAFYLSSRKLWT